MTCLDYVASMKATTATQLYSHTPVLKNREVNKSGNRREEMGGQVSASWEEHPVCLMNDVSCPLQSVSIHSYK